MNNVLYGSKRKKNSIDEREYAESKSDQGNNCTSGILFLLNGKLDTPLCNYSQCNM
jgi:hypothetical protein